MAVFRIQKTENYTIMSNHHLNNKALSLKAKGLLSLMLSLPDSWDYTTRGLASICKEGVDGICATVRELEAAGYIVRRRIRDASGKVRGMEYMVFEQPQKPEREKPVQAKPDTAKPAQENPAQLNTKQSNNEKNNNVSNQISAVDERAQYRALICENIEYDVLVARCPENRTRLDELVELMLDTICSKRSTIRIAKADYPAEVVRSRLLKLDSSHIQYALERLKENPTKIRNIKQYLLAVLYNAPLTIENYYAAQISHDLYGGRGEADADEILFSADGGFLPR